MNLYRVEWLSNGKHACTWIKARSWQEAIASAKTDWPAGMNFLAHDLSLSAYSRLLQLKEQAAMAI